jgi:hypothetical protein
MKARGRVDYGANDVRGQSPGESFLDQIVPEANVTAGDSTLTVSSILSGLILRSGAGAGFADTLPTVDQLLAAAPNLSVGDSFLLSIQNNSGYTDTLTTNTGWTLAGTTTVVTVNTRDYLVSITSARRASIGVGSSTNGSPILTALSDDACKAVSPGMLVTGTGVPASTTVVSVNADTNTITMSANATATNANIAFTFNPTATIRGIRTAGV